MTATSTSTSTVTITPTPTPVTTETVETTTIVVVPTPEVQNCPTPGTYTFPATTLTVTDTTTVCGATTTKVPSGTHTVGGVTTIVTTQTTITCPVATVETTGDVTTSTIRMTEYVCPSAGTYTIGAHTTACETETVIVYPTATTITPGTYTKPQVVVTATETDYVTVCPYTSSGLPTTTPEATPVPVTTATEETPVPETTASETPAQTETSTPAPPSSGKDKVIGTNDHYGITYTPYVGETGACKSADQVAKDIAEIARAGFQAVRIYGTDCSTLENVVPACVKEGLQIIAGIFVKPGQQCSINDSEIKKQVDALNAMNKWDAVRLLVITNESLFNGVCSASALAELIKNVKSECSSYQGPVTIAEPINIWQRTEVAEAICGAIDVVGANIHPYFNPNVDASGAGAFVKEQITILEGICNKSVINLETGWKSGGGCNGKACGTPQDQKKAVDSIRSECGAESIFFSFENDDWKGSDESHWGLQAAFSLASQ